MVNHKTQVPKSPYFAYGWCFFIGWSSQLRLNESYRILYSPHKDKGNERQPPARSHTCSILHSKNRSHAFAQAPVLSSSMDRERILTHLIFGRLSAWDMAGLAFKLTLTRPCWALASSSSQPYAQALLKQRRRPQRFWVW